MSGGMDWDALAGPLFKEISFMTGFAFASFIAFALLALMNVVTGVFVQTALLSAREEEDAFMTSQIIALFNVADKDGSATISWEEIVESLDDPQTAKEWKSIGVQAEDARYLFKMLDLDGTGEVAFEEFMGGALRLSGGAKAIDLLTVMQEQRKNQEKEFITFQLIIDAIIDVHETVRANQEDMLGLVSNCSFLVEGMAISRDEMTNLSYMLGAQFESIKQTLSPLTMLEDVLTLDPNGTAGAA